MNTRPPQNACIDSLERDPGGTASDLDELREQLGQATDTILGRSFERWGEALTLVTSLQVTGVILLDRVAELGLPLRCLTIDTGRLPTETYQYLTRLRERTSVAIEVVSAGSKELDEFVTREGPNAFFRSAELRRECCRLRKVEPLHRALSRSAAWITGRRADRTGKPVPVVEPDPQRPGVLKIQPLAAWTWERAWRYVRERQLPYHPLYNQGFTSIGCAPCTRPPQPDGDSRSGRWWWEDEGQRECGLH